MSTNVLSTNINPNPSWNLYLNPDMHPRVINVKKIYGLTEVTPEENASKLKEQNQRIEETSRIARELISCFCLYPENSSIRDGFCIQFARPCCRSVVPVPTHYRYYDGLGQVIQKWGWSTKEDGFAQVSACDFYKCIGSLVYVFIPSPWVCSGILTGCSSDYSEKIESLKKIHQEIIEFKLKLEKVELSHTTISPGFFQMSSNHSTQLRGIEFCDNAGRSEYVPLQLTNIGEEMPIQQKHLTDEDNNLSLELAVWGDNPQNRSFTQKIMRGIRSEGQHTIPQLGVSLDQTLPGTQADKQVQEKKESASEKVVKQIGRDAAIGGGKFLLKMAGLPV
jgi:hypothetical protein